MTYLRRIWRPQQGNEVERIFTRILRERLWGSEESVSGPGSERARVALFLPDLLAAVRELAVRHLLDAPCGDFNWTAPLADSVPRYTGIDVVRELIEENQRLHAAPGRRFTVLDLMRDSLPSCDLVFCRDCFVHLPNEGVLLALRNFQRSGATLLATTTFTGEHGNEDIELGHWRPINLERPPFSLPPPFRLVDERCDQEDGAFRDKAIGFWRLADLRPGG
jgi:hypothetical protein